eukprot:s1514_g3.t1
MYGDGDDTIATIPICFFFKFKDDNLFPALDGIAPLDLEVASPSLPSRGTGLLRLCGVNRDGQEEVSAYRMPLRRPNGPPGSSHGSRPLGLAGHQGDILSMCPSYTESHSTGGGGGPLLLTAGDDRTARLWALAGPHAGSELICFDRLKGSRQASSVEENPLFEQVQDAQFLCLDGAVALATTTRLAVYRFQLHLQDTSDDIKRLQRMGSYKCCGLLALPKEPTAGQSLVAIAANNSTNLTPSTVGTTSNSSISAMLGVRPSTLAAGMTVAEVHGMDLHGICEYCGELKPLEELGRCETPEVEEPTHCYSCGAGPLEFSTSQARKGSHARCPECVAANRNKRFAPFQHRASRSDQDVDAELLQSVEDVDEARVLEALEAGADADCSRPLLLRDGTGACHFRAAYRGDGRAVPEEAAEQPTSPLKMAVFRLSDCMLDETTRMRLVSIAQALIEHGAAVAPARHLFELRYGRCEREGDDIDEPPNAFHHLYNLLRE